MFTGFLAATSNRIKWAFSCEVVDPNTQAGVDLTGATIRIGIRANGNASCNLIGTNSDGHVTVTDALNGRFAVTFSKAEMNLRPGEYEVGIIIVFANGDEDQLLAANLPIVDGILDT